MPRPSFYRCTSLGMTIPGILRTFYLDLRQQGERNGLLDLNDTKVKNTPFTFVAVGIVESPLWPLDVWEVMGSCQTTILTTHMWKKPERASDF